MFVGAMYEYGSKTRGFSYEYYNLFQSLKNVVSEVVPFDFLEVANEVGRAAMNQTLLETVRRVRPDIAIVVPYTDQLEPAVMDEIKMLTVSVAYFFDDMWRSEYAYAWAPHFTHVTTSDANGIKRFRTAGHTNVLYSPFACNTRVFVKRDVPKTYDVTFVGQFHPTRAWHIRALERAGLAVQAWGHGWPAGRLGQDQMVDVFNRSRVNLNLSNTISFDLRYLAHWRRPVVDTARAWRDIWNAYRHPDSKTREQVKGRHFEINACGAFQISYYVEGLERHYCIGDEIALYASPEDLVEKVRFYLEHEDERESVARNGYARTLHDHSMEQRFGRLFEAIGLCR